MFLTVCNMLSSYFYWIQTDKINLFSEVSYFLENKRWCRITEHNCFLKCCINSVEQGDLRTVRTRSDYVLDDKQSLFILVSLTSMKYLAPYGGNSLITYLVSSKLDCSTVTLLFVCWTAKQELTALRGTCIDLKAAGTIVTKNSMKDWGPAVSARSPCSRNHIYRPVWGLPLNFWIIQRRTGWKC